MKIKKILNWESWSTLEDEVVAEKQKENSKESNSEDGLSLSMLNSGVDDIITTPFGPQNIHSLFRPAKRWDCWIGYTNFDIDTDMLMHLNEKIPGIAALNVLDRYCFVIGVGKNFDASVVKKKVQDYLINGKTK